MQDKRKVLVADGEVAICEVVAEALTDWPGTAVECVHDGHAAVQQIHDATFNLAVIDVELPGLSGLLVAQAALHDNTPVVMTSARPETMAKMVLVDLPHLPKPFRMAELLLASQAAVDGSRENIDRVRASLALLQTRPVALQSAIEKSQRLLGETMMRTGRAGGHTPK